MNNRKYTLIIIGVLSIALGISYSYYIFNKPVKVTEIKDSPFSILLENSTTTFTESTDWYDTKITYPVNNQKISDKIFKIWTDFAKETTIKDYTNLTDAKAGLAINVEGLKYSFYADYKIATSTDTISYVYMIYEFTGGAHGNTTIHAITENSKQEIIPVEQILPTEKLPTIAKIAEAEIRKQKTDRMKSYGNMTEKEIAEYIKNDSFIAEGVKPTRDNYSVAWYDGDDVVISFGQYQVASYAEGLFEVRIPKEKI